MAESIAHPDVAEPLRAFIGALDGALREASAAADDPAAATALTDFAALIGSLAWRSAARPRPGEPMPVCRFLAAALTATGGPLVTALAALTPSLAWTQNPNYRRQPPDPTFLDNYGYAVLAGPTEGPPALITEPRLALGVMLLGPHTHYPLHAHPAVEVYYTLTTGEWWRGDGPWRVWGPGTAIHHPPHLRHATRAGAAPLLAVYLWRGDLATHASLTPPTR
jgi:hypothetical protein